MYAGQIQRRGASQAATFVVAASDSLHPGRADYVCDGVNDEAEFNVALANGGHILGMKGTYNFQSEVLVPDNTTLEFLAGATISVPAAHTMTVYTKNADSFSAIITNSDHVGGNTDIKVIGADIDFNGDDGKLITQGWAAIWLDNCTKSKVMDCVGYDVVYNVDWGLGRAFGILLSDCTKCQVNDCEGSHCGYEGIGIRGDNRNIIVQNCSGYNNKQHVMQGSAWAPTITGAPQKVIFDKCIGDDNILFHGSVGNGCRNVKIQNCIVSTAQMIGEITHGRLEGNIVSDSLEVNNTEDGNIENIVIDGNIIYHGSGADGIIVKAVSSGGSINDVKVSNNQLHRASVGLNTTSSSSISKLSIDNNVYSSVYALPGVAIRVTGSGDITDINIHGNVFDRTGGTNFIEPSIAGDGNIENIMVYNNIINCLRVMDVTKSSGAGVISHIKLSDNFASAALVTFIKTGGTYLSDVLIQDNDIVLTTYLLAGAMDNVVVRGNRMSYGNFSDGAPTNVVIRNNIGYITENSGIGTIANGTTSIAVAHGLAVTPVVGDIVVTPAEAWGNMISFYIDTYTATHFTIRSNIDPGHGMDFAWKAVVL